MLPESDNIMISFGYCGSERARFGLRYSPVSTSGCNISTYVDPPRDLISRLLIITFDVPATFSMYCDAIALANIAAIATLDYNLKMEYLYRW
jgi:hypothetical protein